MICPRCEWLVYSSWFSMMTGSSPSVHSKSNLKSPTQCYVATSKSSLRSRASAKEVKLSGCASQGVKSVASCFQASLRATFLSLLISVFVITVGQSMRLNQNSVYCILLVKSIHSSAEGEVLKLLTLSYHLKSLMSFYLDPVEPSGSHQRGLLNPLLIKTAFAFIRIVAACYNAHW